MKKFSKDTKILLVEDHPDIVAMYKFAFKKMAGLDLYFANDKITGIQQVKKLQPDLILLDLIIPEKATIHANSRYGFDVLAEIRKDSKFKNTPVIVLTNLDSPDDRKKAKKLRALDYVVKAEVVPAKVVERSLEALQGKN